MDTAKLARFTVRPSMTLEDAMTVIEANGHRAVVVLDDAGRLEGVLTDGDIRKAMLQRRLLSTKVREVMNTNVLAFGRADVDRAREAVREGRLMLVPIIDDANMVVDIILAFE